MSQPVTVFWRPGCIFCARLRRDLSRSTVEFTERNIWVEADAAAFVRSVNRGDETVPTVVVGNTILVNPRPDDVLSIASSAKVAS